MTFKTVAYSLGIATHLLTSILAETSNAKVIVLGCGGALAVAIDRKEVHDYRNGHSDQPRLPFEVSGKGREASCRPAKLLGDAKLGIWS